MLTRASRQALRRDAYKQASPGFEAIQLPFLCPAILRPRRISHKPSICKQDPSKPISSSARSKLSHQSSIANPLHSRKLASAAVAVAYDYEPHQDDFIPFEGLSVNHGLPARPSDRISPFSLPGLAPDMAPLILKDAPTTTPGKFRVKDGISGDLNEIHQTLHACLQVGRLDRAAALVRRLNQIYKPDAPGLITAHNDYIREVTLRIRRTRDSGLLKNLHRWFETDLRRKRVTPTPATYALMIQASIHGLVAKHADRSVKRFAKLAKEDGLGDETMGLVSSLEQTSELALRHFESPEAPPIERLETTKDSNASDAVPEIRPVNQKGLGLSTLKKSLMLFNETETQQDPRSDYIKSIEGDRSRLSPRERQQMLERNTLQAALDRWHEEDAHLKSLGVANVLSTSSIGAIMWKWHEKLVLLIKMELQKAAEAESKDNRSQADSERLLWGPYIHGVTPEKLSALAIIICTRVVTLDAKDERGITVLNLVGSIGKAVQEEALYENVRAEGNYRQWRALSQKQFSSKEGRTLNTPVPAGSVSTNAAKTSFEQDFERSEWPPAVKVRVGAMLLSQLIEIAKVEVSRPDPKTGAELREEQPVFFHTFAYLRGKRVGVIQLNPTMKEKMSKAPLSPALAKFLPMLTVPRQWQGFREGGFLEKEVSVVRLDPDDLQAKRYAITASRNGDMSQVFAGLDVLAKTPWKINRGVFDVMVEAWNSGQAIAKIPPENPISDLPPEPPQDAVMGERLKWLKKVKEVENYKGGLRSQRCFQNFQLEVARAFLNETFYFPHNVDFRGRAYPMAPFLNHMGADNARGLLTFAESRILGPNGLWWLKVHLANVFGYDKASFQERVEFTEGHLPEIIDSAKKGLHGDRWWLTAEDPWQCLAACKELTAALEFPDPTKFRSSLAVHQDGTCNGLQHYAALGGDTAGAKQVNLEPGNRPSDIYTAVAEMVKTEIKQDASKGHIIAVHLDGKVTRKVVKQTVMTNVYGVTFMGAKMQVRKQLDAILTSFPDTHAVNRNTAAGYIAKKIFSSLARMFNGAHDIQYWFGDCAGRICSSVSPDQITAIRKEEQGEVRPSVFRNKIRQLRGGPKIDPNSFSTGVIWTTPLKMPVVQPYSKKGLNKIKTNLQLITIQKPSVMDPIHKANQLQAFPPNFIHSLDGTHMFLTALKCDQLGLNFAAVHDSFWTHAGDVDALNRVTRDAFIKMHSENIVERLRAEFETRYKGHVQFASVHQSSAVAKKIRAWRKASGHAEINNRKTSERTKELLLEAKRLELLASDDPKQRKEGEEMITPGSIYEQSHANERILAPSSDMPVALGQISTRQVKLTGNERLEVGDLENAESVLGDSAQEAAVENQIAKMEGEATRNMEAPSSTAVTVEYDYDPFTEPPRDDLDVTWIRRAEDRKRELAREKAKKHVKTFLWVPLKFPPVPKKVCAILRFYYA